MTNALAETEIEPQIISLPFFVRGEIYEGSSVRYPGQDEESFLTSPDPHALLDRVILNNPDALHDDFRGITVRDVIDFLAAAGKALEFDRNPLLQEAARFSARFSGLTIPIIEGFYRRIPEMLSEETLWSVVESEIGAKYLDGWVDIPVIKGRARTRAYGVKTLHIIAGNVPVIAVRSIVYGALVKADNIIKLPSNDPLTATALLRTMRDIDPRHPVVKHFVTLYWKGGDRQIERQLINPSHLEKVIAWGGADSIKHIKEQIGPGIDLIRIDPKFSVSIIGEEAFASDESIEYVADLSAIDSATYNQEACLCSRTHFVRTSPERAVRYACALYRHMQSLDPSLSTRPKVFPADLREHLNMLRYQDDLYAIIGGENDEGAVVTSLRGNPVEFFPTNKVVNVVPIEHYSTALEYVTNATQSVGIYPEDLKGQLIESLVARGAQRLVSLGQMPFPPDGIPYDAMEIMRRSCKWIVELAK